MIDVPLFRKKLEILTRVSENTIRAYEETMAQYAAIFSDVTKENNEGFVGWLKLQGKSVSTINLRIAGVNKYCELFGIPATIRSVKQDPVFNYENRLTLDEYQKLLDCLKNDRKLEWFVRVKIMGSTGARVGELIRIKKSDWDAGFCIKHNKGTENKIYFLPFLKEQIDKYVQEFWKKPDEFIFCTRNNRFKQMERETLNKLLYDFSDKYGIADHKRIHPHGFRHLFACTSRDTGVPVTDIATLLNHKNINTTMFYLRDTEEAKESRFDGMLRKTDL